MKKLIYADALAMIAACAISCNKIDASLTISEIPFQTKEVNFQVGPITKTYFGTPSSTSVPTLWSGDESIAIALNKAAFVQSTDFKASADNTTASFKAGFETTGITSPYTFYALCPYSAVYEPAEGGVGNNVRKSVVIPSEQTPGEGTVDEKAQILASTATIEDSAFPSSVSFTFKHILAYVKLSFSNLSISEGETVQSIAFKATKNLAGRYYYYFNTTSLTENKNLSSTITLNTSKTTDIWFSCAPVDLSGTKLTIVVSTDAGSTFTKTLTVPANKAFEAGKIAPITIDMTGATEVSGAGATTYTLVTSSSTALAAGDEIILVSANDAYAMSSSASGNYRGTTAITKSTTSGGDSIVKLSEDSSVQVITLESAGSSFYFSCGSAGYLYSKSGVNDILLETTATDACKWDISIASTSIATITGTSSGRYLRFKETSSVRTYKNATQVSTYDVLIYRKN